VFKKSFVFTGLRIGAVVGLFVITMIAVFSLSGCGGSSSPVSVAVTASAATVDATDAVTLTATVTNDRTPGGVTWSVSGGGTLSNTTTTSATYTAPAATSSAQTVTVTATSVADTTQIGTTTITVPAALAVTTTSSNLVGRVGTAYSVQLAGTGGISPYIWTVASGSTLPAGLSLSTAGVISGTPLAAGAGTTNVAFVMKDSGTATPLSVTQTLGVTITAAPAIAFSGTMPPTATYNAVYTGSAAASGGVGTLTYSLASGALPTGLSLNAANGAVTGTPTAVGTFNFTINAADAFGDSNTQSYSIVVSAAVPTLTFAAIPAETYGNAPFTVSATSVSGGAVTYSVTNGPATINSTTGVVTLTGAGTVVLGASQTASGNYAAATGSATFTVGKATATINVTPYSLTYDANAHTATATATGLSGVNLIADLTLSGTTHTNAGTYASDAWSFTDPSGNYANASGTVSDLISKATATINVTPYSVTYDGNAHTATGTATGVGGANLIADLTLSGTTHTSAGTYASDGWSFTDPSGNYANASGTVSDLISKATATINVTAYSVTYDGNPHTASATATGVGGATLGATDFALTGTTHTNAGTYASDAWSFTDPNYTSASGTVSDAISVATAIVNVTPYNVTFDGNPHTASATATGAGGVTLSASDFTLSGTTHTNVGTYASDAWSFTDPNYVSASGTVSDAISKATATINVTPYSVTYDGNPHTATATATGAGGVTLSASDFTLSGTTHTNAGPYAGDAWSFTDPSGNYANASGTVSDTISKAAATINVTPYNVTYDGNPHTAAGTATGVGGVSLIADLTLSGTTHTDAGSYPSDPWSFTDPTGNYANTSGIVSDTINGEAITLTFTTIPTHTYGDASFTVSATSVSGGAVTYSVTSGPANINSATGVVTLTGAGTVVLSASQAASGNYAVSTTSTSFTVTPALSITTTSPLQSGTVGLTYSTTLAATGGQGSYTWTVPSSTDVTCLAARGLSLSSGGVLSSSGATLTSGNVGTCTNFGVQVSDSASSAHTASATFTVTVSTIAISPTSLGPVYTGSSYSQLLTVTGGTGPYTWLVTAGATGTNSLAAVGLTFTASTATLSGTSSTLAAGTATFTVQVTDSNHATATQQYTINVYSPLALPAPNPGTLGPATTNQLYNGTIIATGGSGSGYVFTVNVGSTPTTVQTNGTQLTVADGIWVSNNGSTTLSIGGTPTLTQTVTLTVSVKDSTNSSVGPRTYTIAVNPPTPLALPTAGALTGATTNQSYSGAINASGGSGSGYVFTVTVGSTPTAVQTNGTPLTVADGITVSNTGGYTLSIGGTPTLTQTVALTVSVKDDANDSAGPNTYTIAVTPPTPLALPDPSTHPLPTPANINQSYNAGLNATGGSGQGYVFTVAVGAGQAVAVPTDNTPLTLTDGLSATNSGGSTLFITGTPPAAANITLNVSVTDSANDSAGPNAYTIAVINPLAGYDVSGTVNYSGSKTGWIYLELNSNSCSGCGGNLGTAIPAKGAFTIHGVPAGTYTLQAYMDPNSLGYGAQNASDPTGSSASNVTVSSGAVSGVSVTLGDPSAVTLSSAPSIGGASGFSSGAFVSLNNSLHNSNGVETATSYTVRWSATSGFGTVLGSESFPATGGGKSPWIVSGVTNCASCYFEVQGVAGSSPSSWSSAYGPVTIGAPTGGNTVTGTVTLPSGVTPTGPLYVGFYDQNSGNMYATVIASPSSSTANAYTVHVPTGSNYFLFGLLDQKNNGIMGPGAVSNTNESNMAAVVIDPSTPSTLTQNLTLPATGTAPKNSIARITTQHQQQIGSSGTNDNYQVDLRVDGLYKLPVAVELTSQPTLGAAVIPADYATGAFNGNTDEFDFYPGLNGVTPQVGDSYHLLVTYSDSTSETLTVTIGAVLNAFATLVSPASQATGVSLTPNFSWTDPANPTNYLYQFQLMDNNYSTIWQIPGNHSNSNGFSSSILALTWNFDPTGNNDLPSVSSLNSLTTYQWSIQATDLYGNSAQVQQSFETGETTLFLPDNSNPGSALVNNPYSQSLNASGGSGSGYVFTVNSSAGTTNAGVTTWTLTDGLTASSTVGNSTLTVSGTPTTAPQTVTLSVSVTDSQSHTAGPVTYTINIVNGPNGAHNSYLNGTYVCKTDGFNDSDGARWASLSSFTANGTAATITSGIWDMNGRDQSSGEASGTVTGTYSIGTDNNGLMTMNSVQTGGGTGSRSMQYAIALNNLAGPTASEFRMVESDDVGASPSGMHGVGNCYLATPSTFAAGTISGKSFAFGMQGENGSGVPKASVARFTAGTDSSTGGTGGTPGGGITSGMLDGMRVDQSGDSGGTFTGSYTRPSAAGRFTLTYIPTGGGGSKVFAAYIIDANRMFLLETAGDSGVQSGDMRTQLQTSNTAATLLGGPFVLYAQSYRYSNGSVSGYDSEVYQGTGNGSGGLTINQSYMDDNGTYSVGNANGGPIAITFDSSYPGRATFAPGSSDSAYLYFFDNGTAFELDLNGNGYLQTGWMEPQSQTTFTYAAVAGTYLMGGLPPMQATQHGNVGELNVSSSGAITGGLTEAGQGDFSYDQSKSMGTLSWDSTAPGTGTFLIGSGSKGISCAVISATKIVCTFNADSSPGVMILQQ
jgi:hypothetical protein